MPPEVASMQMAGSLETSNIDRAFIRIKQGFDSVSAKAKSVVSDLSTMNLQGVKLATTFTKIASSAVLALGILVKDTPAVAGSMARLNVTWEKMRRTLGEALAPAFRNTADDLEWFNDQLNKHSGLISKVAEKVSLFDVAGIGIVAGGIAKIGATLAGTTVSATLLTALGSLAAIAGGAIVGAKVGGFIGEKTYESVGEKFVTSKFGGALTAGVLGTKDYLTGSNDLIDFLSAYNEYYKRKDNRRLDLLNMEDIAFG